MLSVRGGSAAPSSSDDTSPSISARRACRSSPVTSAMRSDTPAASNARRSASRQASGLTPPALATTRMRRAAISSASGAITSVTKSTAYPLVGSLARAAARIDIVISAR